MSTEAAGSLALRERTGLATLDHGRPPDRLLLGFSLRLERRCVLSASVATGTCEASCRRLLGPSGWHEGKWGRWFLRPRAWLLQGPLRRASPGLPTAWPGALRHRRSAGPAAGPLSDTSSHPSGSHLTFDSGLVSYSPLLRAGANSAVEDINTHATEEERPVGQSQDPASWRVERNVIKNKLMTENLPRAIGSTAARSTANPRHRHGARPRTRG